MTIAEALRAAFPGASVLIATGSPCATHFTLPPGVDVIKLPSVTKDRTGRYVARSLFAATDAPGGLESLVRIRRGLLAEIQSSFQPHLLVVDHQILGLCEELDLVLARAKSDGTRTILGLRDIIDAPDAVAREWERPRLRRALTEEYDRICVYGAPEIFDLRDEYPIPAELRGRLEFTGYIARPPVAPEGPASARSRPQVLVTVGGGEDGAERIESYLEAIALAPARWTSSIVLGPLFDPARARTLKRRAREIPGLRLHLFHSDLPHLLARADAVVSMAGYNSVVEILQSGIPAVLLPRSFPRREQLIRAERLAALGLADCLSVTTPETLRDALERALARGARAGTQRSAPSAFPFLDGCTRLCRIAADMLESEVRPARCNMAP